MPAPLRISVDRETCMGSGVCCVYAPRTFELDDAGISTVRDPSGDGPDEVRAAAEGCPTRSIVVREGEGG